MEWNITCEIFNDDNKNKKFEKYFKFIGQLFKEIIPDDPILGFIPIRVVNSNTSHTIYWPLSNEEIKMGISQDLNSIPEICFKFSHLLCHVYIDPRVNNWFIESICNMAGLFVVNMLGDDHTKYPTGIESIDREEFIEYYNSKVRNTFKNIDLVQQQHSSNWLKREIKNIRCINDCGNPVINYMIAFELFPTFSANPDMWQSLKFFGKSTNPPPPEDTLDFSSSNTTCPDFERLKTIVPENLKDLTNEVIQRIWD